MRGMRSALIAFFSCLVAVSFLPPGTANAQRPAAPAKTAKAVAAKDEPFHHKVRQNDYVIVEDVTVPPHQQTLMHEHAVDHFTIVLGPAEIENDVVGQRPQRTTVRAGQMRLVRGGFAHVVKNVGDTPFHNITIELLKSDVAATLRCGGWKPMCKNGGGDMPGGGTYVWSNLFETATITATHAIADEKTNTTRFHGNLLLVALRQCRLRAGEREIVLSNPGETAWIESAENLALRNVGDQEADFVVLQFAQ